MRPSSTAGRAALLSVVVTALALAGPVRAESVQYRYKSFVLFDPVPGIAQLANYQPRLFDEELAKSRAISASVGGDSYACPLAFQDAAKVVGDTAPRALAVVAYRGCPFDLGFVAVEDWLELREPLTIDIDRVVGNVVYAAPGSAVPFVAEAQQLPFPTPTAVGVTWRFKSSGLRFRTAAGEFLTGRPGATVAFTRAGPRFSGFTSVPRRAGVVPASNGWAQEAMRSVQERLSRLGYEPGPIDGVWGNKTRDALVAFQRASGLSADGTLNAATLTQLGI